MRRLASIGALALTSVASALASAPAAAQTDGPAAAPEPEQRGGRAAIRVRGGLTVQGRRYVYRGQRVIVIGRVRPFVAGQRVTVLVRRGARLGTYRAPIRRASGGAGRFVVSFRAIRRGRYRVSARHRETSAQRAFRSGAKRFRSVRPAAGIGARGDTVWLLQRTLRSLGFPTAKNGYFGRSTARAVLAYRKTNFMGRSGYANRRVFRGIFRRRGRFKLRYPGAGRHVEFDWSRQVLVLANRGRARRVYHASSGKPSTPTVFGTFRFYRKEPGTNSHGMVHSSYFIGGYAIHGYKSVPNYPASHGCIRVPIPNARSIFRAIHYGERIFVYR
jgi:peptidoglycan hydrolase-like protein with peptidoglycan-binding domain